MYRSALDVNVSTVITLGASEEPMNITVSLLVNAVLSLYAQGWTRVRFAGGSTGMGSEQDPFCPAEKQVENVKQGAWGEAQTPDPNPCKVG